MTIGELAKLSNVNAKLIRHYESIGVLRPTARSASGYRVYQASDVQFLRFIKLTRSLGFSMHGIKRLLGLWKNKSRASREVKALALSHVKTLEQKIVELQAMAESLRLLAQNCRGDSRPECPILEDLAGETAMKKGS